MVPRLQFDEWRDVETEQASLRALPRIEELDSARQGFDRDDVANAFVAFEAHIAALRKQIEEARRTQQLAELPGSALRADGLALISAATEYANTIEREANVAATRELREIHRAVEQHRDRMAEADRQLERQREDTERACERMIAEARAQAREILAEAKESAKEVRRRADDEAAQTAKQAEREAAEFSRTARARTDELLEWARKRSAELMEEARSTTQELLADLPNVEPEPVGAEEPAGGGERFRGD